MVILRTSLATLVLVAMAGLAYGQTVLARTVMAAGIDWNADEAHSAIYDTEKTAQLFCLIVNRWQELSKEWPWLANAAAE